MITKQNYRRSSRKRFGATTVEFAMIAPIFFLVSFLCIEFARMSMLRNLAQNAAYEASRFAMMEGASEEDGHWKANEIISILGARDATVETTFEPLVNGGGDVVRERAFVNTRVTIPMGANALALPASMFEGRTIVAEANLRTERYIGHFSTD